MKKCTIASLIVLVLVTLPSAALGDASGATIDKTGWWNRTNITTSTPAGPITVPPPPGIPEDDLVVGAINGEPTAELAIGIQPEVGPGATVNSFVLRVTEDDGAAGNQGTDGAVIVACPITDFWAGGANGDWETRPDIDCDAASSTGTRDDDGVWEFDLAAIGALWFDPFGSIRADGVVLVADPESSTFQAAFLGGEAIDVELDATAAPDEPDEFATPPNPDPPVDTGAGGGNFSGGIISTPVVAAPPPAFDSPSLPESTPSASESLESEGLPDDVASPPLAAPAGIESQIVASGAGDLAGNFSPLVLIGILAFVSLLLTMSYWFGPSGQPTTVFRQRGVSRALAARARTPKDN